MKYELDNIYNADETTLFYRGYPDRGHTLKDEKLAGGKKAKDRITVLVCSNASGSEKQKLIVIGKSKKPRCFPFDVKVLPVTYRNNKNAWMTTALFKEWLEGWNHTLKLQGRKICLLLDNCTAHLLIVLSNIEIQFYPPNTTALQQPMDMGVIKNLKGHYRKQLNTRVVQGLERNKDANTVLLVKDVTLLDAIHMLASAWKSVAADTIKNCFKKGGIVKMPGTGNENREDGCISVDLDSLCDVHFSEGMTRDDMESLEAADQEEITAGLVTDEELLAEPLAKRQKQDADADEENVEEDEQVIVPVTSEDALRAMDTLRNFIQQRGIVQLYDCQYLMEAGLQEDILKKRNQTSIRDFFKPK